MSPRGTDVDTGPSDNGNESRLRTPPQVEVGGRGRHGTASGAMGGWRGPGEWAGPGRVGAGAGLEPTPRGSSRRGLGGPSGGRGAGTRREGQGREDYQAGTWARPRGGGQGREGSRGGKVGDGQRTEGERPFEKLQRVQDRGLIRGQKKRNYFGAFRLDTFSVFPIKLLMGQM